MRAVALVLALALGVSGFATPRSALRRMPRSRALFAELPDGPNPFVLGVLGDLHMDPRDLDHHKVGREHIKTALEEGSKDGQPKFMVSLGDLGESKDCTGSGSLFAGTTECFKLVREYLDGFDVGYDIVGGNHDLEGIDEFETDEENLEAYLREMGKETPQFCHQIAEKTLLVGLGSTVFRGATYTSHEVFADAEQVAWFKKTIEDHPEEEGWRIFCFSHAPIIGSGLRVINENHVVNGCCWLNHNGGPGADPDTFIKIVRTNPQIKAWFSGHFHLGHDYEDSITFPGGSNRGSCIFCQVGTMTDRSTRDGRRQTRFVKGNDAGFEVYTINHAREGELRLDATVTYSDECIISEDGHECSVLTYAHDHEDYDHDKWFSAYVPQDNDGCYIQNADGVISATNTDWNDLTDENAVCWWHMKDGKVLGAHGGMIIEYDPSTLAPLGLVVSRDELEGRRAAVIDDGYGGNCLILYSDDDAEATVIQPNEDGSYWRKIVRNKMHRMREQRRVKAAKKFIQSLKGEEADVDVLSSYGPYTNTAGNAIQTSTKGMRYKVEEVKVAK